MKSAESQNGSILMSVSNCLIITAVFICILTGVIQSEVVSHDNK